EDHTWLGYVKDVGSTKYDRSLLWDIVNTSQQHVQLTPNRPPGARSSRELVEEARKRIGRLTPILALWEMKDAAPPAPVILVDIRSDAQRAEQGIIPDALHIDRVSLESTFDPQSETGRIFVNRYDVRIILFDQDGFASSLAAATLHDIGLLNATDIIGGYKVWKELGLPTSTVPSH
ncbi:uncharacterized protein FOMMEDRAFT_34761, partial [Fomitiporia mediterranea MF3/22]|uniref:uncharacterized protein n=1 Tax=Fomitiporia mediterranea (strain MF3/22) TaxID=694068 RepID=UPI0004408870